MAVDTDEKRASLLGDADLAMILPIPVGTPTEFDRLHLLGLYRLADTGGAASGPTVVVDDATVTVDDYDNKKVVI